MTVLLPLRQRLIGAALRRYREDAGFDQLDAARILDSDRSKICRIEGGERGIRLSELRTLLSEYQADDAGRDALEALASATRDGWWQQYWRVLTADYVDLLATESVAAQIMIYAPAIVPALLYADDYARAVAAAADGATQETTDAAVTAATARQRAVLRESGTAVAVILGEAALRQQVGGPDVLRAQLRHLAELSCHCPRLTIQVLPFTAGAHDGNGGFSILQFGPALPPGLVLIDSPAATTISLDTPEAVAACARKFARLRDLALSPSDSARRLRSAGRD